MTIVTIEIDGLLGQGDAGKIAAALNPIFGTYFNVAIEQKEKIRLILSDEA